MTAIPLIGLTGHAGAGKDSAAAVLVAAGWESIAFADALRLEVADAWGVDVRELTERATKELPRPELCAGGPHRACHTLQAAWLHYAVTQGWDCRTPRSARWLMQRWGEFRRRADPHHWIRPVVHWVNYWRRVRPGLVVTDVRHANEALALRGLAGCIARVHRVGHESPLTGDTAGHESERHDQIQADADIHNAGTLADLGAEVWRVVAAMRATATEETHRG